MSSRTTEPPLTLVPGWRVLFLDLSYVEQLDHIVQVVDQARKHPANPILPLGRAGEPDCFHASPWIGGVLWSPERGLWQMWYGASDGERRSKCYAESDDGVEWHKPVLGLHEYRGSTRNNIVVPHDPNRVTAFAVARDERAPAERRYQANSKARLVWYSVDGIHWHEAPPPDQPMLRRGGPGAPDNKTFDVHCAFFDDQEPDPQKRYKVYAQLQSFDYVPPTGRWGNAPRGRAIRRIGYAYGPDIEHLTNSPKNPILGPEDPDAWESQNHFATVLPYEGQYVMLYECNWEDPGTRQWRGDLRLAVSRDGETWQRIQPNRPVVPCGGKHEWDGAFLVCSMSTIVTGDQIRIYYSGQDLSWTTWPRDQVPPDWDGFYPGDHYAARAGLATLRRDGFCHLEAADAVSYGSMTTRPLVAPAASGSEERMKLHVNAGGGQLGRSWVEVEVLDAATGEPLPGLSRAESPRLWQDVVDAPVRWRSAAGEPADVPLGRPIRLRFHLIGQAGLYAFWFAA